MSAVRGEPTQYRVLRAFKGAQGECKPGDAISTEGWPWGRAALMAEQRMIEPIAPKAPARGRAS